MSENEERAIRDAYAATTEVGATAWQAFRQGWICRRDHAASERDEAAASVGEMDLIRDALMSADRALAGLTFDMVLPGLQEVRDKINHAVAATYHLPRDAASEREQRLAEELAETRAHEHVLVIVGDMLSRHLEWMIREPTPGLDAEVLDAIKARSAPDVAQWLNAIKNAGFKRPEDRAALSEPGPAGPARGADNEH